MIATRVAKECDITVIATRVTKEKQLVTWPQDVHIQLCWNQGSLGTIVSIYLDSIYLFVINLIQHNIKIATSVSAIAH